MPQISIEKAKSGMLVIEKVVNDKGMVLLPEGTELTDALIDRLKKWNVQTINYKSDGSELTNEQSTKNNKILDEELKKQLEKKFQPVLDDPIMNEIYTAVKIYFQGDEQE